MVILIQVLPTMGAYDEQPEVDKEDFKKELLCDYRKEPWHGGWLVAEGGYSVVGLWVVANGNGLIERRIAVKGIFFTERDWYDDFLWNTRGILKEARVHLMISRLNPSMLESTIVRLMEYESRREREYRLVLEYCPYGSLDDLIERHKEGV